jgi:pimeloyl-ACP methyl ester carboxylesterase
MNRILDTPRGPLEYARTGEGPAVLLLHGAMGGYDQGLLLGRTVVGTPGYEFIAPSRPGYLGTPLALGPSPEQQADLCAALLDALAARRASVIAISGGGQCALQFAIRHPDRCAALVMISACSAPLSGRVPLRFHVLKLAARIPPLMDAMRRKAAANPEKAARRSIPDPALRARTLADADAGPLLTALQVSVMDRMAARLPGTQNDIVQSRSPFAYACEKIVAPVLIVHGTEDEAVPFAQAESLAARIPNAELLGVEGGRHVSIFTHRDLIQPRVRRFLR